MFELFFGTVVSAVVSALVLTATADDAVAQRGRAGSAGAPHVLKDTRQYDEYVSAFGGFSDCRMPVEPKGDADVEKNREAVATAEQEPQPTTCSVEKARYVRSGELLVRYRDSGRCVHTVWQQLDRKPLTHQGVDVSAPSLAMREEVYACNEDGSRR